MSNFWAQQLGIPAAPAQQVSQTAPVQPSAAPWWLPQTPQAPQHLPPRQEPLGAPQADVAQIVSAKAAVASSHLTEKCPNCLSENYFKPTLQGGDQGISSSSMTHCFNCGYNPRFNQLVISGGTSSSGSAASQQTKQLVGSGGGGVTNNWHPEIIQGRIG